MSEYLITKESKKYLKKAYKKFNWGGKTIN
jgi:hypothetical protein